MEVLFVLFGLGLLFGFPVAAVVGVVKASDAQRRLKLAEGQSGRIESLINGALRRLDRIEQRLAALDGQAAPAQPVPAVEETEADRRRRAAQILEDAARRRGQQPAAAEPLYDERGVPVPSPGAVEADAPAAPPTGMDADTRAPDAEAEEGPGPFRLPDPEPIPAGDEEAFAAPPRPEAGFAAPPPPDGPSAPREGPSLEERLGTRWTVWVGGLALALGGVFLVKYSIEQGFFGPAFRMTMAALFSALLLAGGEVLRRREIASPIEGLPTAYIPGILTAAGIVAGFATGYGSYALYGFLGPFSAFLVLGLIGFAALLLAVLHGPWLAVLGVFGAYATPLLISTPDPNIGGAVIYLLAVTATAFGIARLRLWRWVAATASVLAGFWGLALVPAVAFASGSGSAEWYLVYVSGLAALFAGILIVSVHGLSDAVEDRPLDPFGLIGLAVLALFVLIGLDLSDYGLFARLVLAGAVMGSFALAWRVPQVAPAPAIAAVLTGAAMLGWGIPISEIGADTLAAGADNLVTFRPVVVQDYLVVAGLAGATFTVLGFLIARRATPAADHASGALALAGTLGPVLILVAAWLRVEGFERSNPFAFAGLFLSVLFGYATVALARRETADRQALSVAVYATGAIVALGAGLAIGLERGALTIALALIVPALAYVHRLRPIPTLRPLAALAGLAVLARVLYDPRIVGDDLGTTPVFNWLLYGYGIPAFGFGFAAWTFRRSGDDVWQRILEALAVVFTGLLVLFEVRHWAHGGNVFASRTSLDELGMLVTIGFLLSAGLSRLAGRLGSPVYDAASMIGTALAGAVALLGLLIGQNPMVTGDSVGSGVVDLLFLGYLLPALAATLVARLSRGTRPVEFVTALSVVAMALAFAYVTLVVRKAWHGPVLTAGPTSDAEIWAYSAAWLVFGVALLLYGLILRSPPARIASAAIIVLTVLKVFLYDMSEVEGLWRALSFIGLGVVLIGIGLLYQKLLFARPKPAAAEAPPPAA
jgi:uncharacterized membrane protein